MNKLHNIIETEILERGDIYDYDRDDIIETIAHNQAEEILWDIPLKTDSAFLTIRDAIIDAINEEIDWDEIDNDLQAEREESLAYIDARMTGMYA